MYFSILTALLYCKGSKNLPEEVVVLIQSRDWSFLMGQDCHLLVTTSELQMQGFSTFNKPLGEVPD